MVKLVKGLTGLMGAALMWKAANITLDTISGKKKKRKGLF